MIMRNLDQDILQLLQNDAVTPNEAANPGIALATANRHLFKLLGERKAVFRRKGRLSVYHAKGSPPQFFSIPNWVRPGTLDEFSDELVEYSPKNVTGAGIMEKERQAHH